MSSTYPWIKDSANGSTPSVIGYLEVTSTNGLYLNGATSQVLLKNPATNESLTINKLALDFNSTNGTSCVLIDNTKIHLNEPSPTTTPFTTDITYQNIILQSKNFSTTTNTLTIQPSSIFLLAPNYTQNIANGTYETTEILTNRKSSITPLEIRIGYDGVSNTGKLYCTDIDSAGNLNVVTINGLAPTTIGLVWADFANPYSSLPSNRYFLSDTTYETYQDKELFKAKFLVTNQEASYSWNGINSQFGAFTIQANSQDINLNCSTLYINGTAYSGGGGGSQDLNSTLGYGNNAGGQSITGVNNIDVSTINGSAYPPYPTSPYGLPNVLSIDPNAYTSINMNSNDINSVNNINVNSINGSSYPPSVSVPQFIYAMPFQSGSVSSGSQTIFSNGVFITGGFTYAVTWTFWYDGLYHGGGTAEMIQGYGDLYSYSFGSITGSARSSGVWASNTISSNSMYRTTLTYTDNNFVINSSDTYYPYIYQLNTLSWAGTIYCSATISRTN